METMLNLFQISEWSLSVKVAEIFYILIGIIFLLVGIKALKDLDFKQRKLSSLFWFILAFSFIFGPYLPKFITGICVILIGILTATKNVKQSASDVPSAAETRANADKIGYKVFIPSLVLAISAFIVATLWKAIGANNAIGISSVLALIAVFLITKAPAKYVIKDGTRLMDNVGSVGILPQVLAALGALFTSAGVGTVIANAMQGIIPEGNKIISTAIYCITMALFTAIMGNAFAAFSVITVGVGIPFLIMHGANPVVVGAFGLTAGYCGTLLTPMAANFNIMPAALLETKDKYKIIKMQAPFAIILLIIHIILMYVFAF